LFKPFICGLIAALGENFIVIFSRLGAYSRGRKTLEKSPKPNKRGLFGAVAEFGGMAGG